MKIFTQDCPSGSTPPHRACLLSLKRHYSHGLLLAGANPPPRGGRELAPSPLTGEGWDGGVNVGTIHRRANGQSRSNRPTSQAPTWLASLLLVCIIPTAHADKLGRLFFTPEQRTHLDYTYSRNAPAEGDSSPFITVNGIVQKNGGPRTVWVNGVAQSAEGSRERTPTAQTVAASAIADEGERLPAQWAAV